MRSFIILDCCSYEVKTHTKLYEYIECFKTKKDEFFKKKLKDGRPVKREIVLVSVCPICKHLIIKFLWYAKQSGRFQDWDDTKIIRGKKADEIFSRKCEYLTQNPLPNPFLPPKEKSFKKTIPLVYYKPLNDGISAIPRYINEAGDAGLKVVSPIKVEKV